VASRHRSVPTLIRFGRPWPVLGWHREEWQALTAVEGLGAGLPAWRPGCGSRSVDPDLAPDLAVRFASAKLRARRIELAPLEDEFEALFERGWSDGLPLVPLRSGAQRSARSACWRDRGEVPPDLARAASRRR
jgi:hypothetical protein